MGMAFALWLDHLHTDLPLWTKMLSFSLAITFGVTIGYSRMFLGLHSIDQVLYGWLIGFWCAFTMQYCVRPYLE